MTLLGNAFKQLIMALKAENLYDQKYRTILQLI